MFLLSPMIGFSQIKVNEDSVNYYFCNILKDYRVGNPLSIDKTLKSFTDNWAKYMYVNNYCGHGDGENSLNNRVYGYQGFGKSAHSAVENCFNWDFSYNGSFEYMTNLTKDEIEYLDFLEKKIGQNYSNRDIAWFIFLVWKGSPGHNNNLLLGDINKYYMTTYVVGTTISFSYVAFNDIYK